MCIPTYAIVSMFNSIFTFYSMECAFLIICVGWFGLGRKVIREHDSRKRSPLRHDD